MDPTSTLDTRDVNHGHVATNEFEMLEAEKDPETHDLSENYVTMLIFQRQVQFTSCLYMSLLHAPTFAWRRLKLISECTECNKVL